MNSFKANGLRVSFEIYTNISSIFATLHIKSQLRNTAFDWSDENKFGNKKNSPPLMVYIKDRKDSLKEHSIRSNSVFYANILHCRWNRFYSHPKTYRSRNYIDIFGSRTILQHLNESSEYIRDSQSHVLLIVIF